MYESQLTKSLEINVGDNRVFTENKIPQKDDYSNVHKLSMGDTRFQPSYKYFQMGSSIVRHRFAFFTLRVRYFPVIYALQRGSMLIQMKTFGALFSHFCMDDGILERRDTRAIRETTRIRSFRKVVSQWLHPLQVKLRAFIIPVIRSIRQDVDSCRFQIYFLIQCMKLKKNVKTYFEMTYMTVLQQWGKLSRLD